MTKSITMYMDARNNNTISFPSPAERIEKKLITGGDILYLTKSGSISIRKRKTGTDLIVDTDAGTKRFVISWSNSMYEKIKTSFPKHCPGYESDRVSIGPITIDINSSGIVVTFDTPDYYNAFGSRH